MVGVVVIEFQQKENEMKKDMVESAIELKQYAADHPDELDFQLAWEAANMLNPERSINSLAELICEIGVREGDYLYYVKHDIPDEPRTLAVLDGNIMLGELQYLVDRINQDYCEKAGKVICQSCGSFEYKRKGPSDCDDCGNLVGSSEMLDDVEIGTKIQEALTDCTELEDGDYEHLWVCERKLPTHTTPANHTWLFVRIQYMEEHERNPEYRYHGEICAVNIGMAGKAGWKDVCESLGIDPEEQIAPVWKAKELMSYGICASLWQGMSNSKIDLLVKLNNALAEVHALGGFKLDAAQNAIGSTGWDFMKGNPTAGLYREPDNTMKKIMRQLDGDFVT